MSCTVNVAREAGVDDEGGVDGGLVAVGDVVTVGVTLADGVTELVGEVEARDELVGTRQPPKGTMLENHRDLRSNCLRNVTAFAVAVAPVNDVARSVRTAPPVVRPLMSIRTTSRSPKKSATSA